MRLGLFAGAALLAAATLWFGIGPHDEGLMLQAARRVGSGELPYRDFWWNYGPGQPLLLAPFGGSLVAWRVIRVVLDGLVAVLAFELAWRAVEAGRDGARPAGAVLATPRWLAGLPLLAWLAVAGAMAFPSGPGPNPAALALALLALVVAPRSALWAGALAGLAAVFRLEIGVAAAVGVALLAGPRAVLPALAVGVLGWLPFVLAAPGDAYDDTLGFLGRQDLQRLPFPLSPSGIGADPNKLLELWLPAILVAGVVVWAVALVVRGPRRPGPAWALAPLVAVGLAYLLGRTDEFHLVPLAAVLPIALAGAAARERRWPLRALPVALVALVAAHGLERQAGQLLHLPSLARVPGSPIRTGRAEARDLRGVLRAVRGRSLFVAAPRMDRVTVGDPLLYVLAGARNPTRYDVLQPGVVTTAKVQREMIGDLRRARPQALVRWHDPRTAPEPNGSGRERGSRLLDRYLDRTYGPERRIGVFGVAARR